MQAVEARSTPNQEVFAPKATVDILRGKMPQFAITNGSIFNEETQGGKFTHFQFDTRDEGKWDLVFKDYLEVGFYSRLSPVINIQGISSHIEGLQQGVNMGSENDRIHARNISFFQENWAQLAPVLNPSGDNSNEKKSYSEVSLKDLSAGQADFVGIDGQDLIYVVEFGRNGGKSSKTRRYAEALTAILADPTVVVLPYVGYYTFYGDRTIIAMKPV